MAANDISIRFAAEGDATLKSAVQAIDAQMKSLNEQLKASTEGMKSLSTQEDASAKRTEALTGIVSANREKLKILAQQYDEAKDKLDKLGEAMRKAQESGDPASIDKATTAYNRQSAEVSKLEGAMAKAEGEISKAQNAMDGSERQSDSFRDKLSKLADTMSIELAQNAIGKLTGAMEAMGKAVVDAGKQLWDMASNASTFADDLITQSIQTGISTQKLQEYAYAARFVDTEVSTVTGALTKLTKNMGDGSDKVTAAFGRLKVSTTDATGGMRNAQDVFWEAIEALGSVGNATERDQLAMTLFGKSAQQLNPLIQAGAAEWNKYAQEAQDAGLVLSNDGVSALGAFNDSLQRIDATMDAAQRQIMAALAPAFQTIADLVTDAAQRFTTWIQTDQAQAYLAELTGTIQDLASGLLSNLGPAVSGAISLFGQISNAVSFLHDNFDKIVVGIQAAVAVFVSLKTAMAALQIASLVTNPVGGVTVAIAGLVAGIGVLIANWDKVKEAGTKAWEMIKSAWDKAGEWFKQIGTQVVNAFTSIPSKISGFFTNAWSAAKNAWSSAASTFTQTATNVVNAFTSIPSKISGFFASAWESVKNAWSGATQHFKNLGSQIVSAISSSISGLASKAYNWAKDMMDGFGRGISNFMGRVTEPVRNLASKISSFLHFSRPDEGPLRDYEKWMPDFVSGLADTLKKSQPVLDKAVGDLAGSIQHGVSGITAPATSTAAAQAPIVLQVDGHTFARLITPYIDAQQGSTWGVSMVLGV